MARQGRRSCRLFACALALPFFFNYLPCQAEEIVARVRLAWGGRGETRQRWTGEISCQQGTFSELQPLGIEADEAAALRLEKSRLIVAPLVKRHFDGCDVTIRAPKDAPLRIALRSGQSPEPRVLETTLETIVEGTVNEPLDELGSRFQAHRSPGDKLRVIPPRDSMVFSPNERWNLRLRPDLTREAAAGAVLLDLKLRAYGKDTVLWQSSQLVTPQSAKELSFDINCPAQESVYRVTIEARSQEGFAERYVPWQQAEVFASREVEFVVVDPNASLPLLHDQWVPELTIDPANPSWWQRLPSWAQVPRLRGRLPGAIGNTRPVVRPMPGGDLVELPPTTSGQDPSWQSYPLPVRQPGTPHLIEVEYPSGAQQHLSISVIEPDAAGRVTKPNVDTGIFCSHEQVDLDGTKAVHRILFWPRTRSPQLLLVNRHEKQPAQYGKLRLLRQDDNASANAGLMPSTSDSRLLAGYISKPSLSAQFGAAETLDGASGLSVQSWSTFLEAANRYAQLLKLSGQNGAFLTVAADGSGLYPSQTLNFSPRYDTGLQATAAQDPTRKDVLELLLRVFEREKLRLVPTVQLATPIPRLEALRHEGDQGVSGVEPVNHAGLTWLQQFESSDGFGALYNPLNEQVQLEMTRVVAELAKRYQHHESLAGVAVQLSGRGYTMLPGGSWGLDDQTASLFSQEANLSLPNGENRFLERARSVLGPYQKDWLSWKNKRIGQLYSQMANQLQSQREDLKLYLMTEELFDGQRQRQQLRESLSRPQRLDQILAEYGLELSAIDSHPGIQVLNPHRLKSNDSLQQIGLDLRLSNGIERDELLTSDSECGALAYHLHDDLHLPSFDAKSPYGVDRTYLSLSSVSVPAGDTLREQLVSELARGEVSTFVQGGVTQPSAQDAQLRHTLNVLQELPAAEFLVGRHSKQPLVLREYQLSDTKTVLLVNESAWVTSVEIPLESAILTRYSALGDPTQTVSDTTLAQPGALEPGTHKWSLQLPPYSVRAWKFDSATITIGEPEVVVDSRASEQLRQSLTEITARTGNLNVQRSYKQLQNPGFEVLETDESIFGWQQHGGPADAFVVSKLEARTGENCLKATCAENAAVSIESHPFAMPATGELTVGVSVLARQMDPTSRLYILLQDAKDGRAYQQYAMLTAEQLSSGEWAPYEFPVTDIPLDDQGQLRVQFHLVGQGEILLDDVELFDLRFDSARRASLVKRIYAAQTALDENRLVDCQRLLNSYWARHLMEYVPSAIEEPPALAEQAVEPNSNDAEEEQAGFSKRLKSWMPRIWR